MIYVTEAIRIDEKELIESFVTSSGPGGQNVNKVASAVQLRFDVAANWTIPWDVKMRLARLAGRRMTSEGVLVIQAQRFRDQARNRADALERLVGLIREAVEPPKPRIATKPTKGSVRRRLAAKSHRSDLKRNRAEPDDE
ncbi:alternative ribosome rescue aminoacyl-tRNA hydrolase ArfB [Methylobrevis pamukkalensis]|uniref:Peptidyl-tRNA hydrolase ArfB n=1 Tax=Methylobrevis pamukkalensis TaxID=1439726 RepID=A0A1E3H2T8_9HYPH|nr:alternative ribosome rescue aminoacyl-tRNA hydrolase ArfB [Methylobrevis pamukkalensis]ODN69861.1 Peptidyl-tRNA hydrolase ArfB [Methylobrevis pamukkalensis]